MSADLGAGFEEFWDPEDLARRASQPPPGQEQPRPNGHAEWPEPVPLAIPDDEEAPYPVDVLPPLLRDAVEEYAEYGQQPTSLIAASALSSTSLTTQGLADVARDEHLRSPLSLYSIVIANSGERKTSADKWFKSPVEQWMHARNEAMRPEIEAAAVAATAWKIDYDGAQARAKAARGKKDGKDATSAEDLREELLAIRRTKPAEIVAPYLFFEDANNPALTTALDKTWPSASLWSDEGGLIVGGHGMSDEHAMAFLGLLNRLWDGNAYTRDRATTRRVWLRGRRFTVSLMAQPIVMDQLLHLAGGASRGMGFIARFLLAWPASKIGTRRYRPPVGHMPAADRLRTRLQELLDLPLPFDPADPDGLSLAPPVLRFTTKAQRLWAHCHDRVEAELGKTGRYANVADIGAKVAENTARLAGNFHVLEFGPAGAIDSKTLYRAFTIALWHLQEAHRALAALDHPQSVTDAALVLEWLLRQPDRPIDPRDILRTGPRVLRGDVQRRDTAIVTLTAHSILFPAPRAALGRGAKRFLLNPRAREMT